MEQSYQEIAIRVRDLILRKYNSTMKELLGLMVSHTSTSKEWKYLEIWQQLVIKCKNSAFRFIDHLDTVAPRLSSGISVPEGGERKLTWDVLHQAVGVVKRTALNSLQFYSQAVRLVPVETAVARIEKEHGNLTVFAQAVLTAWWQMLRKISSITSLRVLVLLVSRLVLLSLLG